MTECGGSGERIAGDGRRRWPGWGNAAATLALARATTNHARLWSATCVSVRSRRIAPGNEDRAVSGSRAISRRCRRRAEPHAGAAHFGRRQLLHDPAVDVAEHLRRQVVAAGILPQADRHASGIEQPQVFANPIWADSAGFRGRSRAAISGRGRDQLCQRIETEWKRPTKRNRAGKDIGQIQAMRKAIVPPQPNPARKIRLGEMLNACWACSTASNTRLSASRICFSVCSQP